MKKLPLFALLLAFAPTVFAQTDLDFGEEYVPPRQRSLDRWATVLGTKEPARVVLKWDAMALLPPTEYWLRSNPYWHGLYAGAAPFSVSVEGKITPAFSIVGAFGATRFRGALPLSSSSYSVPSLILSQRVEPRFYFEMPRRSRSKKQADNLTGNYVGLEYAHWSAAPLGQQWVDVYRSAAAQKHTFTLRAGLQRRFLARGWFDLSLGAGRSRSRDLLDFSGSSALVSRVVFAPRLGAGLIFGDFPEKNISQRARCAVFGCRDEAFLWRKIDLFGLLVPHTGGAHGRLSLAWEMKLGRSPLSVELEAQAPYRYGRQQLSGGTFLAEGYVGIGAGVEPRWFVGKNLRVSRGRSAHNLNGFFVGWNTNIGWQTSNERQLRSTPLVGVQSRIFDSGFVSYKVGYGKTWARFCTEDFFGVYCTEIEERHLFSEFKAGYLF